eukprot:m.118881 g.118881  ORF g.118881 m.118881 type:complete len:80 (+) comp16137_c0_seq3:188-427(+)
MGYIESFDDFAKQAEALFIAQPERTRFFISYRHSKTQLVLKVTDDRVCLKYRTDQSQDLRKMEKLNNTMTRLMFGKAHE